MQRRHRNLRYVSVRRRRDGKKFIRKCPKIALCCSHHARGARVNFLHSWALKAWKTAAQCGVLLRQSRPAGHGKDCLTGWRSPEEHWDLYSTCAAVLGTHTRLRVLWSVQRCVSAQVICQALTLNSHEILGAVEHRRPCFSPTVPWIPNPRVMSRRS